MSNLSLFIMATLKQKGVELRAMYPSGDDAILEFYIPSEGLIRFNAGKFKEDLPIETDLHEAIQTKTVTVLVAA